MTADQKVSAASIEWTKLLMRAVMTWAAEEAPAEMTVEQIRSLKDYILTAQSKQFTALCEAFASETAS